ncbi:MAG: hypothetical protein R3B90_09755 [Planctomycetaceae bacterium]
MASKKSGGGAKQFLINHGEKLGLGVIGLVVIYALATANWSTYDGDPYQIIKDAEQAQVTFDNRPFTPEDRDRLELSVGADEQPAALVAKHVLEDWGSGTFEFRVPFTPSPKDKGNPLQEVEPFYQQHPIRKLLANASYIYLNLGPDTEELDKLQDGSAGTDEPIASTNRSDAIDDRFARRTNPTAGGPMAGMSGGAGNAYSAPELDYYASATESGDYGAYETGGMDYGGVVLKGRGQPYVSVRGIIPLHELIRAVQEARSSDFAEAAQHFQIIDYVLERQVAGPNGKFPADDQGWEEVDRSTADAILDEVDGLDLDPVPPPLTDSAVTMPLPPRITGVWNKLATHPDIENFSLSPEEMDAEFKFQLALLDKARKDQAATTATETGVLEKKGWSGRVYDSRELQAGLMGSESSYGESYEDYYSNQSSAGVFGTMGSSQQNDPKFDALVKELASTVDRDNTDEKLREYIKSRVSAVGNILLFRFIDFAVEPGKSYRYRARLVLENPNRLDRVTDATDPSVVQGDTRLNAWSNITDPTTVPKDTFYFVDSLELDKNKASFDFFHFDPRLGTVVTNTEPDEVVDDSAAASSAGSYPGAGSTPAAATTTTTTTKQLKTSIQRLEVAFGEPIKGSLTVWELNPGSNTFEKDELPAEPPRGTKPEEAEDYSDGDPEGYQFDSGDLLVAGLGDIQFERRDLLRLEVPKAGNYDPQLAKAVLVAKSDGRLSMLDTQTQAPEREFQESLRDLQNEPFRELKLGPVGAAGDEYGDYEASMYGGSEYDMMGEAAGGRRSNTRSRSALRRSGSKADAGVRGLEGARGGR